uniref:protein BIG GRAIN 1-like A n=1 Tax=Erigeron canadensis TaxID=72917 RepID=UPI001CB9B373|nr:protein BIG GRAIN 1-like A [Erigeron canadensis]
MYGWNHKSLTQNNSRQNTQNPSFSSSLLDEIYCSMDVGVEKSGESKLREDNVTKKKSHVSGGGGRGRGSSAVEDEGIASLRRAFLVQKWLEMIANAKNLTHRKRSSSLPDSDRKSVIDNDPFFFGSVLSPCDTSSDSFGFYESRPQKPSCFGPFKPKHVKDNKKHDQHLEFGGYCSENNQTRVDHGGLIKSKARALKIYANLKKVRQPISPGGRLTTFLNSLFTNGHHINKKPRDLNNDKKIETISKSTHGSTCSSASSFTRSCLSKNSPRTREKLNNGIRRTVRFYPISVIIDEDCRPCGEKIICDEKDLMKVHVTSMTQNFDDQEEEDDYNDDDTTSDTSSDLFELDHLSILQECEELPVYGTTHFHTNCAIANGLIC